MKQLTFFVGIILSFLSCVSDEFTIGSNLVSVNGRNILIDTCSVELYTEISDPMVTSGISRILTGAYTSAELGKITSHAFLEFNPPNYNADNFSLLSNIIMDSITLILKYDDFSYGDTTKTQTIHIHKLTETLELDDRNQLYTNSTFGYESTPWITRTFTKPNKYQENDSIVELRLPNEFGQELINMMHTRSDTLESLEHFHYYLKGLALLPGNENTAINSFVVSSDFPVIKLYYRTIGVTETESTLTLAVNTTTAFSNVTADRSNTRLDQLTTENSLPSADTDHKLYIQGLTGIYSKLYFPTINELLKIGDFVKITYAYLYIYPTLGTYDDFTPLPQELSLNYINASGDPMDIYVDQSTTQVQSGTLVQDFIFPEKTYYAFDISSYLKSEIGAIGINKRMLQLQLPDADKNSTIKSLIFGDSQYENNKNRIKLYIYFTVYDNA